MPKCELLKNIPLHVQEGGVYEPKDRVGENAFNLDLPLKFGLTKKTFFIGFPNRLLENV